MGLKSRRKGKAGELELARLLKEQLGENVARNLSQCRDAGHDLIGIADWAVEVKRSKTARLSEWWTQTCDQAQACGLKPALAYRLDRQPWRVRISLADLLPDLCADQDIQFTADMALPAFVVIVRESLP